MPFFVTVNTSGGSGDNLKKLVASGSNWTASQVGQMSVSGASDQLFFGLSYDDENAYSFDSLTDAPYRVSLTDGSVVRIGTATEYGVSQEQIQGHAWDGTTLWAVGSDPAALYSVNRTTGVLTRKGNITEFGVNESSPYGLFWDGTNLFMLGDDNDALFLIDRATGGATRRGSASQFGVSVNRPRDTTVFGGQGYFVSVTGTLYRLNLTTGEATAAGSISGLGGSLLGLEYVSFPPEFAEGDRTINLDSDPADDTEVATITATDPDSLSLLYSLEGDDAAHFTVAFSTGRIGTLSTVENGQTYVFDFVATNSEGKRTSIEITVVVASALPPHDAPDGFTITPGPEQIVISWTSVEGLTYEISPDGTNWTAATSPAGVGGLTAGTPVTYYLRVAASGGRPESSPLSASATPLPSSPAPEGFTAIADVEAIVLEWDTVEGVVYEISADQMTWEDATSPARVESLTPDVEVTYYLRTKAFGITPASMIASASATPIESPPDPPQFEGFEEFTLRFDILRPPANNPTVVASNVEMLVQTDIDSVVITDTASLEFALGTLIYTPRFPIEGVSTGDRILVATDPPATIIPTTTPIVKGRRTVGDNFRQSFVVGS